MCDANKNCVPGRNIDACAPFVAECSNAAPLRLVEGSTCRDGECYEAPEAYVIQSDPTFMLKTDIFWYGFLYTTASYSTRFNDQFNVFRPGTPGQVLVADDGQVEMLSFTDPESGITYAASQPKCSDAITGGTVGLCGVCEVSTDCAGYVDGYYGEVFCVDDSWRWYLCSDCTNDETLCGPNIPVKQRPVIAYQAVVFASKNFVANSSMARVKKALPVTTELVLKPRPIIHSAILTAEKTESASN